jgi:hypothetical protein
LVSEVTQQLGGAPLSAVPCQTSIVFNYTQVLLERHFDYAPNEAREFRGGAVLLERTGHWQLSTVFDQGLNVGLDGRARPPAFTRPIRRAARGI